MDRLNFNHLYYFYIVALEGSIKNTALKLNVSQPTISDQIKLLEEYFDCKLFERGHRQLTLTKEGEVALEYAKEIFSKSVELTARLRNHIKIPKSSFDIGMSPYMSQYFLYDFIMPVFDQKEYTVSFHEDLRHILLAELEQGNIDIIFTDDKDTLPSWTEYHRVGMNKTFVVAHKKFRKFKKSFPQCLNEIPYLSYSNDSTLKRDIEMFFSQNSITPKIIGKAQDFDLYQLVTKSAIAFTIVPESAKNRLSQDKDIIVLGEIEQFQSSVWGVIKKGDRSIAYKLLKGKL